MSSQSLALDRASVRSIDADGHLHVERTPISMAAVNPYFGHEIPDAEQLGLDPDRIYQLYRDPDELARAASTFEGKPLLIRHKPVKADDHPKELTVGAIGSPVNFDAPHLTAPLTVWDGEAIKLIDSEEQRELSSSYRYRADMTPGTTPDGEPYDGVMRDIAANHLAIVTQGRAGPSVYVHDSAITLPMENDDMAPKPVLTRKGAVAQSALMVYLRPKLAQDAKIDLKPILAGLTSKNFGEKRGAIIEGVKKATAGKLAADAKLDDIGFALDIAKDDMDPRGEDEDLDEEGKKEKSEDESEEEERRKKARDKRARDKAAKDKEACDEDESDAEDEDDEDDEKEEKVSKSAMDAAIRSAAANAEKRMRQQSRDLRVAEQEVRPVVGEIAVACDSAEDVYRHALNVLKVDITDVPPSAYRALFKAIPAQSPTVSTSVAMDAAAEDAYSKRFPNAGRLK